MRAHLLVEPKVVLDRDVGLTMDARNGRRVTVSLPLPNAVPQYMIAAGDIASSQGDLVGLVFGEPDNTLYAGSSDPHRTSTDVTSMIVGQYTKAGADPLDSRTSRR